MVWFTDPRGVGAGAGAGCAVLIACVGTMICNVPSAHAADLDYDSPRYDSTRDYYGDREPDWRSSRPVYSGGYGNCPPREFVREDLRADGWRDFRIVEPRGNVVLVEARRINSARLFLLRVDRCSGNVITAEPMGRPRRVYLRRFDDNDWRWRNGHDWGRRAEWRARRYDRAQGREFDEPRHYGGSY